MENKVLIPKAAKIIINMESNVQAVTFVPFSKLVFKISRSRSMIFFFMKIHFVFLGILHFFALSLLILILQYCMNNDGFVYRFLMITLKRFKHFFCCERL